MLLFVFVDKGVCVSAHVCGHTWISHDFIVTGQKSNRFFSDVCNLFLKDWKKKREKD